MIPMMNLIITINRKIHLSELTLARVERDVVDVVTEAVLDATPPAPTVDPVVLKANLSWVTP